MTATAPWAQVPDPAAAEARPHPSVPFLVAAVIGLVGPVARTAAVDARHGWTVVVVGVLATVAAHLQPPARWLTRILVVAVAGAVLVPLQGPWIAGWLAAGVLLGQWATRRLPPLPFLPAPGPGAAPPVAVLCVVAAVSALDPGRSWQPAVPFGIAALVPIGSRLGGGALDRAAKRLGAGAGAGVGALCFTVLALLLIVAPWPFQRLLRIDPLRAEAGWVRRGRRTLRPVSPWAPEPTMARAPLRRRVKGPAVAAVAVFLVVAFTPAGRGARERFRAPEEQEANPFVITVPEAIGVLPELEEPVDPGLEAFQPGDKVLPAAHRDDAWWIDPTYEIGQGFLLDVGWRPTNPIRLLDVESRYVSVVDGRRKSWAPPPCACKRLTVWIYGGSTTFGLDQRDDHTIPSELARLAAEQGLTVDVQNRGQLGEMHWMEAERFAWDLTVEEAPDLVLFYDGVNDGWATNALNDLNTGDINQMFDPTLLDIWRSSERSEGAGPPAPQDAKLLGRHKGKALELEELAVTTVERYDRSRQLTETTARLHGIPVRYYWQPSRYSRPVVLEEPHFDADQEDRNRLALQIVVDHLPPDVVDLTDVLDELLDPTYTDDVHHNEQGARTVAEAIYADIDAELRALHEGENR
ncbi:MAG: hypothetical protein JWM47_982 [Acidimicrobiales bacterium]|nr:hypothetical protein [Acidimicrobiales bacterium]